jgi:hypothetical protein
VVTFYIIFNFFRCNDTNNIVNRPNKNGIIFKFVVEVVVFSVVSVLVERDDEVEVELDDDVEVVLDDEVIIVKRTSE